MSAMKVVGGIVAGALVGSAIALIADPMSGRTKRKLRRSGAQMAKTVGSVLDTVMYLKK